MGEKNIDMVVEAESFIGDLPIIETLDATLSDEVESQEKKYPLEVFGGILARPTTGIYMMIMITENITMIS